MASQLWKCDVCGYIHKGDAPPDLCPVCGVGRELFSPFAVAAAAAPALAAPPAVWRCTVCDHQHRGAGPPERCPVCGAEASLFAAHDETRPPGAGGALPVENEVRRVLILGAGIAGLTAAEHARGAAPDVAITILSREAGPPYYRLNLTRLLAGEVDEAALQLQGAQWFADQRIELRLGEAASIDRRRQEVRLRDGATLPYDRLVLATGAHAFVPPLLGATREGVCTVRTLEDARQLLARATPGARCVCIGGGLLGLETAGALARRGLAVTVLEGFGWLLPRQLAQPAGQLLERHLVGLGLTVRTGARVEEFVGDETVRGVRLAEAPEPIPAELVVITAGIRPNSYLARLSGVEVKSGVVVDDRLYTSDPAILAAGDVAEHRGVLYGIWPACYAQGAVAGVNAVGGNLEFQGLAPSNRLKVLDVDLFAIGQFQPLDASYAVWEEQHGGTYLRLVTRDGQLVGANLYGDTTLAGVVIEAITDRVQLAAAPGLLQQLPAAFRASGAGAVVRPERTAQQTAAVTTNDGVR